MSHPGWRDPPVVPLPARSGRRNRAISPDRCAPCGHRCPPDEWIPTRSAHPLPLANPGRCASTGESDCLAAATTLHLVTLAARVPLPPASRIASLMPRVRPYTTALMLAAGCYPRRPPPSLTYHPWGVLRIHFFLLPSRCHDLSGGSGLVCRKELRAERSGLLGRIFTTPPIS
jgi:hypothetical protein